MVEKSIFPSNSKWMHRLQAYPNVLVVLSHFREKGRNTYLINVQYCRSLYLT